MSQQLPKILPVNELKNTANIMKICKESSVPIVITKNGYGEAVMMSIELFEKLFSKVQVASLVNQGIDEIEKGDLKDSNEFFSEMKKKYGEKL